MMLQPRVLISLLLGFGVGTLLFQPHARLTEEPAIAMAAAPLTQPTRLAKAWLPVKASQRRFLQPLERNQRQGSAQAVPAIAEAGKIFDFNLTLPLQMFNLLALTFFLDKTWFGPVGKVLDDRDEMIRKKLGGAKGNNDEVDRLTKEAEDIVKKARAESQAKLDASRKKNKAEFEAKVNEKKEELARKEKSEQFAVSMTDAEMDAQAKKLAEQIVKTIKEDKSLTLS